MYCNASLQQRHCMHHVPIGVPRFCLPAGVPVPCTVLYCTALYCTVLYCTVLYCTVLYCTVLYWKCTILYCTALYCTVLYCTGHVPYCTALHCTALVIAQPVLTRLHIINTAIDSSYYMKFQSNNSWGMHPPQLLYESNNTSKHLV